MLICRAYIRTAGPPAKPFGYVDCLGGGNFLKTDIFCAHLLNFAYNGIGVGRVGAIEYFVITQMIPAHIPACHAKLTGCSFGGQSRHSCQAKTNDCYDQQIYKFTNSHLCSFTDLLMGFFNYKRTHTELASSLMKRSDCFIDNECFLRHPIIVVSCVFSSCEVSEDRSLRSFMKYFFDSSGVCAKHIAPPISCSQ